MIHHIIPKHEWRARFGSLKGVNAPDNLVELSLEQHIEVHRRYGEEGSINDQRAYRALSGQIGKKELLCEIARVNVRKMKHHTLLSRKKMSVSHLGNKSHFGIPTSQKTKRLLSQALKGRKHSAKHIDAGAKTWKFIDPNGNVITIRNLANFCRNNNLDRNYMRAVFHHHYGFRSHKGYRSVK
jgi:NUMOD3 motif